MEKSPSNPLYIKGLDEVRAVAALGVLFHHVELYKFREGHKSIYDVSFLNPLISALGENCVYIFFCLSGFLITTLLLKEKTSPTGIDTKFFYLRRVARIFPLYYLVVFLSFTVIPFTSQIDFFSSETFYQGTITNLSFSSLMLFLFVLPNLALSLGHKVVGASQAWSVGVEEQFYLIWPWVIKRFTLKTMPVVLILFIIIKFCFLNKLDSFFPSLKDFPAITIFIKDLAIEYMATGGLAALLQLFLNNYGISLKKQISWIFIGIAAYLLTSGQETFLRSIFFSLMILASCQIDSSAKWLQRLGQKSYGIYMYHPMIIYFTSALFNSLNLNQSELSVAIFFYSVVILATTTTSHLSFNYFEMPLRQYLVRKYIKL